MHRAGHTLLRFVAGFVAGVVIVFGIAAFLLSRGPVSLDAIAPLVARVLSRGTGIAVSVDHTQVSVGDGARLVVRATGLHLSREGGGATLTLADVTLEFGPGSLVAGAIAPSRMIINGPDLTLDRDPSGALHLGVGDLAPDIAEDWGAQLIGELARPPAGRGALGFLTEVTVRDAGLTVTDRALNLSWRAHIASASLQRTSGRTRGNFLMSAGQAGGEATISGDFNYSPTYGALVVRLAFSDVRPAQWAEASDALAVLAPFDLPVSGQLLAEIDPQLLTLRDGTWDLRFGQGELRGDFLPGGAIEIGDAELQAGYDANAGRINIGRLVLDLPRGRASAAGTIDGIGADVLAGAKLGAIDADLALGAQGIKIDDLPQLWPEGASSDTRAWVVQHLHDGTIQEIAAQLGLRVDLSGQAPKPVTIRGLDGTMKYTNLSVEYLRPLPLVRNVDGTARFGPTEITFTATGGNLGNIRATGATARFYQLDTHDEQARIEVAAQGPLAEALAVLDTPPLGYARAIGIDANRAQGSFSTRLVVALPLIKTLPLSLVDYSAEASLADVAIPGILFGRDLTKGALKLKLDRSAADVTGTAALADVPLEFAWRQSLEANAATRTHYAAKATLDDAQRDALGLDFLDGYVTGPVDVDASYDLASPTHGSASATVDLARAAINLAKLNWRKPAEAPATAAFALDIANDKVTALHDGTLSAAGMEARYALDFDDEGVSRVALSQVLGGDDDFRGSAARAENGGWRITGTGKSIDITGLIEDLDRAPAAAPLPPLQIELAADRVVLGPQRAATAVTASLASDAEHWLSASMNARLSDAASASLSYGGGADARDFHLSTEDFGALLKLLNIYDDIQGGQFQLTGHAEDRDGRRVLLTQADGSDYRVVQAPALARLLSLASFSGISALLSGQGIPFNRIQGGVNFTTGAIALDNLRAYGGAIGINASGTIDRAAGQMNVSGTLVPAYTLNSIIGDIPVLGDILVGGKGQGIFASNFRLYGPFSDPQMSVNALSTLAPGVLRNLFLFSPRGG